jgi:hypothetical protein
MMAAHLPLAPEDQQEVATAAAEAVGGPLMGVVLKRGASEGRSQLVR